jgi:hypothetical protein
MNEFHKLNQKKGIPAKAFAVNRCPGLPEKCPGAVFLSFFGQIPSGAIDGEMLRKGFASSKRCGINYLRQNAGNQCRRVH